MASSDTFVTDGIVAPYRNGAAIVPGDTSANDIAVTTRSIYVGVGGTIVALLVGGATLTFVGVPTGSKLDIRAIRVFATGTTATNLIALW